MYYNNLRFKIRHLKVLQRTANRLWRAVNDDSQGLWFVVYGFWFRVKGKIPLPCENSNLKNQKQ